tara:strand:+ start:241 stop:717 length:477 start_codon:yes stop_codon:yes gene_type:complete
MWENISNVAKTAAAFLQLGKAPPNTPEALVHQLEETSHLSSKKFFIVFSSVLVLAFFYFTSVAILFFLPLHDPLIAGYTTLFSKTIEILSIIIASYLGVQALVDLKYGSSSNASMTGSAISEMRTEKQIQQATIKYEEVYKSDKSYAPINWIESQPYE